ncbi:integral membrane protein [Colletotrichum sublineola]|nr:integral membrane protein [Colletotrichum sublineola]
MAGEPTSWLQNLGIAIQVFCPALTLVVVLLRLYIRFDTKNLGWDDACICAALALTIGLGVGSIICIKELYIGIHYYEIPPSADPRKGMLWIFIVSIIYNSIVALTKHSVLIFLLRFSGVKHVVRNIVWVGVVFNIFLTISTFVAVVFQCTPIEAFWSTSVPGKCINRYALAIATGSVTILTDIITVSLPFYIFLGLKMNQKKKNALVAVFALGVIVTVVSIVRLYFVAISFTDVAPDKNFSLGFCVSQIECSLAITTASAPALWPLIRRWLSHYKSTRTDTTYNQKYSISQMGRVKTLNDPITGGRCFEPDGRRSQIEEGIRIEPFRHNLDEEWTTDGSFMCITNPMTTKDVDSRVDGISNDHT